MDLYLLIWILENSLGEIQYVILLGNMLKNRDLVKKSHLDTIFVFSK